MSSEEFHDEILMEELNAKIDSYYDSVTKDLLELLESHKRQTKKKLKSKIGSSISNTRKSQISPSSDHAMMIEEKNASSPSLSIENLMNSVSLTTEVQKIFKPFLDHRNLVSSILSHPLPQVPNIDTTKVYLHKEVSIHDGIIGDCIEYIDSKDLIVIGGREGFLSLYKSKDFQRVSLNKAFNKSVYNLKYSRKQDLIYTISACGSLKMFKISKAHQFQLMKKIKLSYTPLYGLLLLEDVNLLVCSGWNIGVIMLDMMSFKKDSDIDLFCYQKAGRYLLHIPKYQLLAMGLREKFGSNALVMYDLNSRKEFLSIKLAPVVNQLEPMIYLEKKNWLVASVAPSVIYCWELNYKAKSLGHVKTIILDCFPVLGMAGINDEKEILLSFNKDRLYSYDLEKNENKEVVEVPFQTSSLKVIPRIRAVILGSAHANAFYALKY
jgi:hypothetical protein